LTVLQAKPNPFVCGIVQDPWMLAVNDDKITVPIYAINSETFHWRSQTDDLKTLFENLVPLSVFSVLKRTIHPSFSDLPILFGGFMRLTGALVKDAEPGESMARIVESSVEFIRTRLDGVEGEYFSNEKAEEMGSGFLFGDKAFAFIYSRFEK
jgi:hypothetical protein